MIFAATVLCFTPWQVTLIAQQPKAFTKKGPSYEQVLEDHPKWTPYDATEKWGSNFKYEVMERFEESGSVFMPEPPKNKYGYVSAENQFVEYRMSGNSESTGLETNFPVTSVGIYPLRFKNKKLELLCHSHAESKQDYTFQQYWWTTAGGMVDEGQTPINTLLNELYEESGYQTLPSRIEIVGYSSSDIEKKNWKTGEVLGTNSRVTFYVVLPTKNAHTIENVNKKDVSFVHQFFPFALNRALDKEGNKVDLEAQVLWARERGDFDYHEVSWKGVDVHAEEGQVFVKDLPEGELGRFKAFQDQSILADINKAVECYIE